MKTKLGEYEKKPYPETMDLVNMSIKRGHVFLFNVYKRFHII